MMSVNAQNSMALETLSQIQDTNLYQTKDVDDDAMSEECFQLQISDEEEEEDASHKKKEAIQTNGPVTSAHSSATPSETEDDILNKFDTTDNLSEQLDDKLEDKLLDEGEESDQVVKDDKEKKDISEISLSNDKNEECVNKEDVNSKDLEDDSTSVNNSENVTLDIDKSVPIVEDNVKNVEDETSAKDFTEKDETNDHEKENDGDTPKVTEMNEDVSKTDESVSKVDEDKKEESKQQTTQQKEQQKERDDILKNQIMDTEDLLQIVDKEQAEETDKEDSSGRNSPGSPEEDMETDKMDVECEDTETEKMDCDEEDEEELRITKQSSKEDDGVDIDESSPYKDCDADMDKEYNNLVARGDLDESSQETTKKPETSSEAKDTDKKINTEARDKVSDTQPTEQENECATTKEKEQSDDSAEKENEDMECSAVTLTAEADKESNSSKPGKRSLSASDIESDAKKLKLNELEKTDDKTIPIVNDTIDIDKEKEPDVIVAEKVPTPIVINTLNAIEEYIKLKSLKKLTYKDLEQIVLQKICEAICHKSEIGELRHQLGVQEQMVEMWRKEVVQLTKQAKDLEIVNKRLLHEVRLKNEKDKPLIPVKITRSVGLQVRSDNAVVNNVMAPKRRINNRPQVTQSNVVSPVKQNRVTTVRNNVNNRVNTVTKVINNNNNKVTTSINKTPTAVTKVGTTNKIVNSSTNSASPAAAKLKTIVPKTNTTQTSQNSTINANSTNSSAATSTTGASTTTTSTATTTPTATTTSTTGAATTTITTASNKSSTGNAKTPVKAVTIAEPKTVIDLTDEDDKKPVGTASNQNQTVRIVSTPVKTTSVTTASVVNSPTFMYVYNNHLHQGVLATDASKTGSPKLMLKLNSGVLGSTNGVIAAVSNGSAIAVRSTPVRGNQVQPVRLATPVTSVRTNATATPVTSMRTNTTATPVTSVRTNTTATPVTSARTNTTATPVTSVRTNVTTNNKPASKHPAPLPAPPANQSLPSRKPVPPKPHLTIKRSNNGLILSWKMPYNLENYEAIASYQLYAYQETTSPPSSEMWRKVGDVKALALPMACTLTQFADGNKYHFAVRAVDVLKRMGPFSDPEQILL